MGGMQRRRVRAAANWEPRRRPGGIAPTPSGPLAIVKGRSNADIDAEMWFGEILW